MTTSILRTAETWWVHTASGAARIATDAATTAELLADRAAIDAAATEGTDGGIIRLSRTGPVDAPLRVTLTRGGTGSFHPSGSQSKALTQPPIFE